MKWFFSFLLLINFGLFIWFVPHQKSASNTPSKTSSVVGNMLLLNEKKGQHTGEQETESGLPQVPSKQLISDTPAPVAKPKLESDDLPPAIRKELQQQFNAPIDSTQSPKAETLLDEEPPQSAKEEKEPPVEEETANIQLQESVEEPALIICQTLGPLDKRAAADILSVQLRAIGLKPELYSETRNEQVGYWVLIPSQNSKRKALELTAELERKGVKDIWRFTSGELANAISLGLFRDQERAEIRRKSIENKGFSAVVRPRRRESTEYWLGYQFSGEDPLSDEQWLELTANFPDVKRSTTDCPDR